MPCIPEMGPTDSESKSPPVFCSIQLDFLTGTLLQRGGRTN